MPSIPFLDLDPQNKPIHDELMAAVERVIASGQFILGPEVEGFEKEFAEYCGVPHAVATNSGTSALHLGLLALDIQPGDEVITVAFTFAATVEAILYCGAKPVYVDIDPNTLVMDVAKVEGIITERTKAIIPVHLYGNPVDMGALRELADRHGIPVLEDACQAHGALHGGKKVGSWGVSAAFSFYPSKNLGAIGEGGILTTSDEDIAESVRILRNHGETARYRHERLGFNYRMSAFQGAVLRTKLPYLEAWNEERRRLASLYKKGLRETEVKVVEETTDSRAVYNQFVVMVEDRAGVQRSLQEKGIATSVYYPVPLTRQRAFIDERVSSGAFPVTERAADRVLSLPLYPGMGAESVMTVVEQLIEILI